MIRFFLFVVSQPLRILSNHLSFRLDGFYRLRFSKCHFWGPNEFMELAPKAMAELETVDSVISQKIVDKSYIFFWDEQDEQIVDDMYIGHFGINNSFCAWGEKGLIFRIVFAYFTTEETNRSLLQSVSLKNVVKSYNAAASKTQDWLKKYSFPQELIDCIEIRKDQKEFIDISVLKNSENYTGKN